MNETAFAIYNIYISKNGIKPDESEKIFITDKIDVCICKFINWYKRAYDFATGDPRDILGLEKLNNEFLYESLEDKYKEHIENNLFLIIMLKYIKSGDPYDISHPEYIVNIINIKWINNEIIEFDVSNMIGSIIFNNLRFKLPLKINTLKEYIFEEIKNEKKLYISEQIKILYENKILLNNIISFNKII
jgi:hypothetical protein